MATTAVFLVQGWTAPAYGALAITIGGVVCIAASNSGDTSQDLKTGYIVGSTPRLQQIALMIGVVVSTIVIGSTLNLMNTGLQEFHAAHQTWDIQASHPGVSIEPNPKHLPAEIHIENADKTVATHKASEYRLLNAIGSTELQDGKYLYSPATGKIEVHWIQGIGSASAPAPQARLMATVINGILSRKLPWGLASLWSSRSNCLASAPSPSPSAPICPSAQRCPSLPVAWCAGWSIVPQPDPATQRQNRTSHPAPCSPLV
jgi:hypothetical protein